MISLYPQCEYSTNPLGVGTRSPRFSWMIPESGNFRQVGFRLSVFESASQKEVADTGFVKSSMQRIRLENLPLTIQTRYDWTVAVTFSDGSCCESRAFFETSFFDASDWFDDWTTPCWVHIPPEKQSVTFLRGEFGSDSPDTLIRARAYVGATTGIHGNMTARMNMYRLAVNGKTVGEDVLDPGQLSPRRGRGLVRTFDILPLLRAGENALGLVFISAKISVRILLESADGTVKRCSMKDGGWVKRPRGPFVRLWTHDVAEFDGKSEYYDAREEFSGWDLPGFRDFDGWQPVDLSAAPDILTAQMQSAAPFLRKPVQSLDRRSGGGVIADFGENRNGYVRILAKGAAGTRIQLNYAEAVGPDGELDPTSTLSAQLGQSMHHDVYWKKSDAPEWYSPSFALHGFRFAEITGMKEVSADDLEAVYVMSSVNAGFEFHCSDPTVQRLMELCVRGCQSNLMSVPTDCCTRERLGWGADAAAVSRFETAVFDLRLFYEKWFRDLADDQNVDGSLPALVPFSVPLSCSALVWSRGYLSIAMDAWEHYGDPVFLEENFDTFQRFGGYLLRITDDDGLSRGHCIFSDHFAKDRPDSDFLENAHALNSFQLLARFAEILGREKMARSWNNHAQLRKKAVNRFLRNGLFYGLGTQSETVHALAFHIVPESDRPALLEQLCRQLKEERFLRTGYTGTELLMRVLEEEGEDALAWLLLNSSKQYTWGHWLKLGLTTSSEAWNPEEEPRTTLNHPALCGGLGSWIIRVLCGIRPLEPGYRKILVSPRLPSGLAELSVSLPTPYGIIRFECGNGETRIQAPSGVEIVCPE